MKKLYFTLIALAAVVFIGCDNDEDLFVPGLAKHIDEDVVNCMMTGVMSKSYSCKSTETFIKDENGKWSVPNYGYYPDAYCIPGNGKIKATINIKDGKFWINNHNIYTDRHGGYLGSAWETYEKEANRKEYGLPKTYTVFPFDINDWSPILSDVFPVRITDSEIVLCYETTINISGNGSYYVTPLRIIYNFVASNRDFTPEPYHPVYNSYIERDLNMINKMAEFYDEDSPIATYVREFAYDLGPEYVTIRQLRDTYSK